MAGVAIGAVVAAVLGFGGFALHALGERSDDGSTMTVAELDQALGITEPGSREFDRTPASVLQAAMDREAHDAGRLQASGLPSGAEERLGVVFTAADRPAADRLAALLARTTRFTVAVSAPTPGDPHWSVGGITAKAPLTIGLVHQLTERMSEATWCSGGVSFGGWRVVGR